MLIPFDIAIYVEIGHNDSKFCLDYQVNTTRSFEMRLYGSNSVKKLTMNFDDYAPRGVGLLQHHL
jgi:uncharacterized membrane protein